VNTYTKNKKCQKLISTKNNIVPIPIPPYATILTTCLDHSLHFCRALRILHAGPIAQFGQRVITSWRFSITSRILFSLLWLVNQLKYLSPRFYLQIQEERILCRPPPSDHHSFYHIYFSSVIFLNRQMSEIHDFSFFFTFL